MVKTNHSFISSVLTGVGEHILLLFDVDCKNDSVCGFWAPQSQREAGEFVLLLPIVLQSSFGNFYKHYVLVMCNLLISKHHSP